MRSRWKLFGAAGISAVAFTIVVVGHSRFSRGDTAPDTSLTSSPTTLSTGPTRHDPTQPYDLGSGAIFYEAASAAIQADVDGVLGGEATRQPPASSATFSAATAFAVTTAQGEIAARSVGLVDSAAQGVIP